MTDTDARRNYVGNAVYPCIMAVLGDQQKASKITGMIIDERVVKIGLLLTDFEYLNKQVNDANALLSNHQSQPQPQPQPQVQVQAQA